MEIIYNPLKPEHVTIPLQLNCKELGSSMYNLELIAKPPKPEKAITIEAWLGQTSCYKLNLNEKFNDCSHIVRVLN